MRTILLNGGDMVGVEIETDVAVGDTVPVVGPSGQTLLYRVEADGRATFVGTQA